METRRAGEGPSGTVEDRDDFGDVGGGVIEESAGVVDESGDGRVARRTD